MNSEKIKKLHGVTTAMITPFNEQEEVDYKAIRELTDFLIDKGVNCLYPCGTTGEMLHLTIEERKKIAETIVKQANNRVTVYIHVGSMMQNETIELAKHAFEIGADGIGVVTPTFFSLNDREMEEYYISIAKSVPGDFPVYLYNIPQLSANDLKPSVVEKVVERCSNVIGIKYSYADFMRTNEYLQNNKGDFSVLHGADSLFLAGLSMGCDGTVSGISCIFPEPYVAIYKAYNEGKMDEARRLQVIANKYCKALKGGSNMAYFKEGLKLRGINGGNMRKPQLNLTEQEIQSLKDEIQKIDIY